MKTMIHLGYHQFTYRCIIICCLIFNFVLMIQANQVQCRIPYNLKIQDEQIFTKKLANLFLARALKFLDKDAVQKSTQFHQIAQPKESD